MSDNIKKEWYDDKGLKWVDDGCTVGYYKDGFFHIVYLNGEQMKVWEDMTMK